MANTDTAVNSAPGEAGKPKAESAGQSGLLSSLLLPSFSEACKLVGSTYSCLEVRTHRRHLALSPRYLNKKRTGIQEQLNGELLKYSTRMDGVPLAYDNIKIVGEVGEIQDDIGYIHLNIQADFVIFQPRKGEKLVGLINKVAPSHIGCLVHGCFNAAVPKPLKMPNGAWQHIGVTVGDQIVFEVFRVDSDVMGVFFVCGKMDKKMEADAIEKLNEATKEKACEVSSATTERPSEDGADPESQGIPKDTPKKKAKKRRISETLKENISENPEVSDEMNRTLEEIPKKKSKKSKRQEINPQSDISEVDASIENNPVADSSSDYVNHSVDNAVKKIRKKKKHHESLLNVDADNNIVDSSILSLDSEPLVSSQKKSKKKKHKDNETLQNGLAEGSSFIENIVVGEDMRADAGTVLENQKNKPKKKHKRSSATEDSSNGGTDFASQESLLDDSTIQETPKHKKHKRKSLANAVAESDDSSYLAENVMSSESQTYSEPKAKKKRKE